jgi:hypothetical protein
VYFSGICLTSNVYQPYFYFSDAGIQTIHEYAATNGYNKLRIYAYPILHDNLLVINGTYVARDTWTMVEVPVTDINSAFYFWSQSQGATEIYLRFEFV